MQGGSMTLNAIQWMVLQEIKLSQIEDKDSERSNPKY